MILRSIKAYMQTVRTASLQALCVEFKTDADTMRCYLSHFLAKGSIKLCLKSAGCGTRCAKCPISITERYEWAAV